MVDDMVYLGGIPLSGADVEEIAVALGALAGALVDAGHDYAHAARLQALFTKLQGGIR